MALYQHNREENEVMKESVISKIMKLKNAPLSELQQKYQELFGKASSNLNRIYLWRKISYRMQEIAYGGLPEEAVSKIQDLIKEHDPINNKLLRPENPPHSKKDPTKRDRRLPIPGTLLTKHYKGTKLEIKVLEKGF
jgi:hypothetical protein